MKMKAFTLAETLIVIGIIGVVAALTLPNLNHATGDKEKVTKVKKIYSSLADAYGRAEAIYGPIDEWFKDMDGDLAKMSECFGKRITEFMKISKDCGHGDGCFSSAPLLYSAPLTYEDEDGNEASRTDRFSNLLEEMQDSNCNYMVITSDGMSLGFRVNYDSCNITVDIDGPNKGKNQIGNDIFYFSVGLTNDNEYFKYLQLIPDISKEIILSEYSENGSLGGYATAWVIDNDNMDYMKCPSELNWNTQTSCK